MPQPLKSRPKNIITQMQPLDTSSHAPMEGSSVLPGLPTPTFTGSSSRHRHAEKSDAALQLLMSLFADDPSNSDSHWRPAGERSGVRISAHDTLMGSAGTLPVIRGDGIIEGGFAPREVMAVINSLGARKIWDTRFDGGKLVQIFNPTEWLAHIALKGTFPMMNRDVVVMTQFYRDERNGFLCYCSTSVEDSLVPIDPQKVRGHLGLAGWVIRPDPTCMYGDRLKVTYIVQMDVGGQMPQSIAKMLQRELPTCISGISRYLRRFSFPPHFIPQLSPPRRHALAKPLPSKSPRRPSRRPRGGIRIIHDTFEHRLATYDLAYRVELNPFAAAVAAHAAAMGSSSSINSVMSQQPSPPSSSRSSFSIGCGNNTSSSTEVVTVEVRIPQPLFPHGVQVDVRPAERVAWQLIDERTGKVIDEGGEANDDDNDKGLENGLKNMSLDRDSHSIRNDCSEEDDCFASLPSPVLPGRLVPLTTSDNMTTVPTCAFGRVVRRRRVSNSSEDSDDITGGPSHGLMPRRAGVFAALPAGLQTPILSYQQPQGLPRYPLSSSRSYTTDSPLPPPLSTTSSASSMANGASLMPWVGLCATQSTPATMQTPATNHHHHHQQQQQQHYSALMPGTTINSNMTTGHGPYISQMAGTFRRSTSALSTPSSNSPLLPPATLPPIYSTGNTGTGVVGQIGVRGLSRSNSTSSACSVATNASAFNHRRCISPMPVADWQHGYETRHPGHRLVIYNDARIDGRAVQVCVKKRPSPHKQQRLFGTSTSLSWIHRD
ncbi:hypothetical protein BDF19DRAFT_421918 [Syncephalis fuscata]|nr:hypothetical protein BDF19DRAFT_421918 [Syncephalis fuscata]